MSDNATSRPVWIGLPNGKNVNLALWPDDDIKTYIAKLEQEHDTYRDAAVKLKRDAAAKHQWADSDTLTEMERMQKKCARVIMQMQRHLGERHRSPRARGSGDTRRGGKTMDRNEKIVRLLTIVLDYFKAADPELFDECMGRARQDIASELQALTICEAAQEAAGNERTA